MSQIKTRLILPSLITIHCVSFAGDNFINKNEEGVAIRGYDPVAYFTEGKPVQGTKEHAYEWMDAQWYFSTEQNRNLFILNPDKYAPQFGGHCAFAAGHGYCYEADPLVWSIVDAKLYLNNNKNIQKKWLSEGPTVIEKGHAHWPEILKKETR